MTVIRKDKIGGLLLAAGGSSRIGTPKQLLQFKGRSLLRRAAEMLAGSACDAVVVMLGAETERSADEISDLAVNVCINTDWETGMSSSIRAGLRELQNIEPDLAAVVITLCDQPNVTADNIDQLITEFRSTGSPIIAAAYGGTTGVPALFTRELFGELLQLEGDTGARQIIRKRPERVRSVKMEQAVFDIDTLDDLKNFDVA